MRVTLADSAFTALLLLLLADAARGDIYMHNLRGSNNRLDEGSGNTNNPNRLFDSQNNNAGGYGFGGDADSPAAPLRYFGGSELHLQWTAQHSCGNANTNCQFVVQYMCGDEVRDGTSTNRINPDDPDDETRGKHEPASFYNACAQRQRNEGLFIADQNLNGNSATRTRQNPNGNRYGLECAEERDYYPYWHPSPWIDVAVITSEPERCEYYKTESQNVKPKGYCSDASANNPESCAAADGDWLEEAANGADAPTCIEAPWLRDNHLGNGVDGYPMSFNWTVPDVTAASCVARIRYNISTAEIPFELDASANGDASPIDTNPKVDLGFGGGGGENSLLELAVNTNQYGRTFQDRSHVFSIEKAPVSGKIYNVNVIGKRGNIVQAYPAVEYDYAPSTLTMEPDAWVHFQWTGNDNVNNNGNNNGEGRNSEDQSNVVQIASAADNVPLTRQAASMFDVEAEWSPRGGKRDQTQLVKEFGLVLQTDCLPADEVDNDQQRQNCEKLNAAPRTVDLGLIRPKKGTYNYMSSRNNNFSNRSQKGTITVGAKPPKAPAAAWIVPGSVTTTGMKLRFGDATPTGSDKWIDASAPQRVDEYKLLVSEDGGSQWREAYRGPGKEAELRGLMPGFVYALKVQAANDQGWSEPSETSLASTTDSALSLEFKERLAGTYVNVAAAIALPITGVLLLLVAALYIRRRRKEEDRLPISAPTPTPPAARAGLLSKLFGSAAPPPPPPRLPAMPPAAPPGMMKAPPPPPPATKGLPPPPTPL